MTFFNRLRKPLFILILLVAVLVIWEVIPENRRLITDHISDTPISNFLSLGFFPQLQVAYTADDGKVYATEDHYLYVSESNGNTFRRLGSLPKANPNIFEKIKDRIARSKPVRRLRRNQGPANVVALKSGTLLVFYDQIYRSTDGGATFEIAFSPGDHELAAPFDMGIAVGSDDTVYYGEYIATRGVPTNRVRVVLGSDDGTSWDIVYTFALGEIRHIHSITYDSFRDRYWVCTGDVDAASRLLYTDDNFNTLHELGGGSQDWRIVSLIVTPDFLYWGSDNSQTGAAIFRWSFANEKLEKLQDIGNVSYYSTILKNGTLVVSTTYEPDSLYTKLFNPQATADIWVSRSGIEWTKIVSLPHELRHGKSGPSRAQIAFPSGGPSELLYYTPYATREHEFTVQVLRPE